MSLFGKVGGASRQTSMKVKARESLPRGYLVGNGVFNNSIFDLTCTSNRDDCYEPYLLLKSKFFAHGISLNTADLFDESQAIFEIHMNVHSAETNAKGYLLRLEASQVLSANGNSAKLGNYQKVFTWQDDLLDGDRFIKINLPNQIRVPVIDGWGSRGKFCCMIAGNKTVAKNDYRELYSERVRVIRWFETHAPADFDLYGVDWDLYSPPCNGPLGKLFLHLSRYLSRVIKFRPFPSYRGRLTRKRDVLVHTRFSICYENLRDLPGYITEKIFDCFFSGCVPVYWGASNVTDYIPADCFIDRRKFSDTESVYNYLKQMTEEEFCGYQERIAAFLRSEAAHAFSAEAFAETIVRTIVKDIVSQS